MHRALESTVELRSAEAAVEARGRAVADDDATAHGQVLHVVGPRQAAVHAVEGGRLRRAHVGADLVDQVETQAEQAAIGVERGLHLARALGRHRGGEEVLAAVLRPAHRHSEQARRDRHQHHRVQHGRLRAERAAALGRGQQPQLRARDPERGRRDAVQRERPLEVRPRGHPARLPVRDHAVALDRCRRGARVAEVRPHDVRRPREGRVRVAVAERAIAGHVGAERLVQHRRPFGQRRLDTRRDPQRLVIDEHALGGVLRDVAVACHDDAHGLTGVAGDVDGGGVVDDARAERRPERPRVRGHVDPGDDADHAGQGERGGGIDLADAGVREGRADDRGDSRVRQRIEIVDEPALAPQQRVVLDAQRGAADMAGRLLTRTCPGRHVPR